MRDHHGVADERNPLLPVPLTFVPEHRKTTGRTSIVRRRRRVPQRLAHHNGDGGARMPAESVANIAICTPSG